MQNFIKPDDIYTYGRMVNRFSDATKNLAALLEALGFMQGHIKSVIGVGRYNSLNDKRQNFIHYGRYITEPLAGLFGAFVFVHLPELVMAKQMPTMLGKIGCRFVVECEGNKISVPLDQVSFDFITMTDKERGRITLSREICVDGLRVEKGTPITSAQGSRQWATTPHIFSITDHKDNPIDEYTATTILWGHIGAAGIKRHGQVSAEFSTIASDGTDDDFTAEIALISCLNNLQMNHAIDLMPQFNDLVVRALDRLMANPEMLECMSVAINLLKSVSDEEKKIRYTNQKRRIPFLDQTLARTSYLMDRAPNDREGLELAVRMLGLTLPLTHQIAEHQFLKAKIEKAVQDQGEEIRELFYNRLLGNLRSLLRDRHIKQNANPFDEAWLNNRGNILALSEKDKTRIAHRLRRERQAHHNILEDLSLSIKERLTANGISQFQRHLQIMANFLVRLPEADSRLVRDAITGMNRISVLIGTKPLAAENVSEQIAAVRFGFDYINSRPSGKYQPPALNKGQAGMIRSFLKLMEGKGCDLQAIIHIYGECRAVDELLGVGTPRAPAQNMGQYTPRNVVVISTQLA